MKTILYTMLGLAGAATAGCGDGGGGLPGTPPPFESTACGQVNVELCLTPEGLPRRLSPDDEMFALCAGSFEAHPVDFAQTRGREVATITYGSNGEIERVDAECGSSVPYYLAFEYDDGGRLMHWERPGVRADDPYTLMTFDFTHDGDRPVERYVDYVSETGEGAAYLFEYGETGLLERFVWEEAQPQETSGRRYLHDDAGQLLEWRRPTGDPELDISVFGWTDGRITSIERTSVAWNGDGASTLVWDGDRLREHTEQWEHGLVATTTLTYDDAGRVAVRSTETSDGEVMFVAQREYDDQGRLVGFEWWGYHKSIYFGTDDW